jgi:hypothetical protein
MAKKKSGRMSKLKRYGKTGLAAATVPLEYLGADLMADIGNAAGLLIKAGVPLFEEGGMIKKGPYKPKRGGKPLTEKERQALMKKGPYKPKSSKSLTQKELIDKGMIKLLKEGGKVKSKSPRGCGMALRGYGKAMKKGKK